MYLYFDKKGILKEVINDKPLRQGEQGNKIYIYVEDYIYSAEDNISYKYTRKDINGESLPTIESSEYNIVTNQKVPYNSKRDLKFFDYTKSYNFLEIPTSYDSEEDDIHWNVLNNKGNVALSVYFNGSEAIDVLGLIIFNIEESANGDLEIQETEYISLAQWNYLKNLISGYKSEVEEYILSSLRHSQSWWFEEGKQVYHLTDLPNQNVSDLSTFEPDDAHTWNDIFPNGMPVCYGSEETGYMFPLSPSILLETYRPDNRYLVAGYTTISNRVAQSISRGVQLFFVSPLGKLYCVSSLEYFSGDDFATRGMVQAWSQNIITITNLNTPLDADQLKQLPFANVRLLYNDGIYRKYLKFDNWYYFQEQGYILFKGNNNDSFYAEILRVNGTTGAVVRVTDTENFYNTTQVDNLLSRITGNAFVLVDTSEYPTLASFLASTGEEGDIYLYPVEDVQNNYYKYIWENNRWISLGTTEMDVRQFVRKTESAYQLYGTDDEGSQATLTYSEDAVGSTIVQRDGDGQVSVPIQPISENDAASKEYVDDNIQEVREVAEGKCSTFVLSYAITIDDLKHLPVQPINIPIRLYDLETDTWTNIKSAIGTGDYDNATILNSRFNSQNADIDLIADNDDTYFIFSSVRGHSQGYYLVQQTQSYNHFFKTGDVILVTEVDVPDRWFFNGRYAYKLETSKVDLTNVYKKNESLIPSDNNAYTLGDNTHRFISVYLEDGINFYGNWSIEVNQGAQLDFVSGNGSILSLDEVSGIWAKHNLKPATDNAYDLGNASYRWKDGYFGGKIYLNGSTNFIYKNSSNKTTIASGGTDVLQVSSSNTIINTLSFTPLSNNYTDIGSSSYKYKDIWVNNIKGVSTMTQAQYDALATKDSDTFYFIEEE